MSVTNASYKTLKFSDTFSLVLDQNTEVDFPALKEFLDKVDKGDAASVNVGPYVSVNTKINALVIQGYPIANGWMASGKSDKHYTVSFDPIVDKVTLVLYYLYHMAVTV
jgi:hypothetical protein